MLILWHNLSRKSKLYRNDLHCRPLIKLCLCWTKYHHNWEQKGIVSNLLCTNHLIFPRLMSVIHLWLLKGIWAEQILRVHQFHFCCCIHSHCLAMSIIDLDNTVQADGNVAITSKLFRLLLYWCLFKAKWREHKRCDVQLSITISWKKSIWSQQNRVSLPIGSISASELLSVHVVD